MRQSRIALIIIAVLALGTAPFVSAQMMGGSRDEMPMSQNATLSHSATMGMDSISMMNRSDSLIGNMSQYCDTVSEDFDKLQAHFDKMMEIQNMNDLRVEMQRHYDMLQKMQEDMNRQRTMYHNMMTTMYPDQMHGMLTSDSTMNLN